MFEESVLTPTGGRDSGLRERVRQCSEWKLESGEKPSERDFLQRVARTSILTLNWLAKRSEAIRAWRATAAKISTDVSATFCSRAISVSLSMPGYGTAAMSSGTFVA